MPGREALNTAQWGWGGVGWGGVGGGGKGGRRLLYLFSLRVREPVYVWMTIGLLGSGGRETRMTKKLDQ